MSRDLVASAHQECVSSMNKLRVDAAAAKQASKGRRRKATNVTQPATSMSSFFYFFHNHGASTCKQNLQSHAQPF
jgi:hypothetical protein